MQVTSPIPKQSVGKTFLAAILVLGAVALLQLGSVGWVFLSRFHANEQADTGVAMRASAATPTESLKMNETFAPTETETGQPAKSQPQQTVSLARPTPIIKPGPEKLVPQEEGRMSELIDQAKMLRDRGDMSTSLIRLREAQAISPNNPNVISEMAITYEKMGLNDKAMEQWLRIRSMGESAGIYFAAADAKLKAAAGPAQPSADGAQKDASGFQPGSVLALVDITKADSDDQPNKRFTLKIPLKTLPGTQIDVHDVVVQVFFYDLLDDKNVVRTNANVNYKWLTTPANWNDADIQILQVDYMAASVNSKEKNPENRKYFGYIVRVYYKNSLQDMRAEPIKLLQQYPPPLTLSNEEMQ